MSNNTLDVLLFASDVTSLCINTQFKPFSLLECHARHFLSFHISNYFYLTFMSIRKNPTICIRLNLFAFVENTKRPCLPHEARLISIIIPSTTLSGSWKRLAFINVLQILFLSNQVIIKLKQMECESEGDWLRHAEFFLFSFQKERMGLSHIVKKGQYDSLTEVFHFLSDKDVWYLSDRWIIRWIIVYRIIFLYVYYWPPGKNVSK